MDNNEPKSNLHTEESLLDAYIKSVNKEKAKEQLTMETENKTSKKKKTKKSRDSNTKEKNNDETKKVKSKKKKPKNSEVNGDGGIY